MAVGLATLPTQYSTYDAKQTWPQADFRVPQALRTVRFHPQYLIVGEGLNENDEMPDVTIELRSSSSRSVATVQLSEDAASHMDGAIATLKVTSLQPLLVATVVNADAAQQGERSEADATDELELSESAIDAPPVDAADHFTVALGPYGGEPGDGIGARETLLRLYCKQRDGDLLFQDLANTNDNAYYRLNVVVS